ncbi:MAG: 5-bromo-4-chloroindolyl phosphate hydrolysis family protein [Pseudophaeobacter sp. bin_em_oilr2.035]|uniref:5-bromo-4-chloroindolyl phosphate hydrolysis family protein n=1 Tax=Phaeobacter gallaeciensis TaxID=60890 RepID=A0ABD4X8F9_9RHOB|nr:5-bromo-4-chloroindolyl phosphate hydrolysis family protein [Phaeobacter gallaeciensis]MDF1770943.1 5-bromo-4-chloroindolyl phosphate hydrolysis family protein [Pseudophaeobacter sp. bin_em_oilr2.035]MDE4144644.1 5-bromo-4-chloroindolyl phosphate hydrolysis family protein [Phaeobacter gallaeciensis]MDE4157315.1 5-bromo-4-chloroindolyl phosphate hydrolysis family protein [Phaeobacter gallaeciensis]MDE4161502.1 5-bromo-4-chloroindolyl phosphate hydrolysis family protein [Phaeobacter gallaecien
MAQRYGGKYSPDGAGDPAALGDTSPPAGKSNSFRSAQVDPVGARANTMFVPGGVLLILSLNDGATGLALGGIAAALWTGAAFLLREGLRAETAFAARRVARKPALPRKILASVLTGAGAALAAWKAEPGIMIAAVYGLAATGLHLAAFGLDPLQDKGVEGVDDFQQSRVARAVDEAEAYLDAMRDAALRARDRQLEARVDQFQAIARDMFRTIEEDPRDLTGARKYLTVYLQGARDATIKFADIYARSQDPQARSDYLALLEDLEQNFAARTQKMLLEDRSDLTIEIDVLRDRLQREGVRLDRN